MDNGASAASASIMNSASRVAADLLASVVQAGASRQVVAATTVALWRVLAGLAPGTPTTDIATLAAVEERLDLMRPILTAQVVNGRATGDSRSNPKGLVKDAVVCRANAAKHVAFDAMTPISKMSLSEIKRRQRGRGSSEPKNGPRTSRTEAESMSSPRDSGGVDDLFHADPWANAHFPRLDCQAAASGLWSKWRGVNGPDLRGDWRGLPAKS